MGVNLKRNNEEKIKNINAIFIKKETSNGHSHYIGKVKTFDTRFARKPMTLDVLVEQYYCAQKKKSIIILRFSPKEIENATWYKIEEAKLRANVCGL